MVITAEPVIMKLTSVTKLDMRNTATSKKLNVGKLRRHYHWSDLQQFKAIRKPDSGRMTRKTYIFSKSSLSSYKN